MSVSKGLVNSTLIQCSFNKERGCLPLTSWYTLNPKIRLSEKHICKRACVSAMLCIRKGGNKYIHIYITHTCTSACTHIYTHTRELHKYTHTQTHKYPDNIDSGKGNLLSGDSSRKKILPCTPFGIWESSEFWIMWPCYLFKNKFTYENKHE